MYPSLQVSVYAQYLYKYYATCTVYMYIDVYRYISDLLALSMNVARYFLCHHEKTKTKNNKKQVERKETHWNHCHHISIGVWTYTSRAVLAFGDKYRSPCSSYAD